MKIRAALSIAVLSLASINAHAQTFGTWRAGITDGGEAYFAATVNDSGNLLGEYRTPVSGNCVWLLGMSTTCKEGGSYLVLANSDAGAAHIQVQCSAQIDNGLYRYVFNDFEAIDNIVKQGLRVGFAVPLQGDLFRIVRFDLGGSNRAIAAMLESANQAQKQAPSKSWPAGTKDQNL